MSAHRRGRGESRVICPYCGADDDRVIDSRASEGGRVVRRRRHCNACEKRYTTYERVEQSARLIVIKRDGSRDPFDRDKILQGVRAAFGKRKVSEEKKLAIVEDLEEELHREFDREVASSEIGERVMQRLRDLDDVAYVRFASEHYKFRSIDEIKRQLDELGARIKDVKDQQRLFDAE